ncbi:hypothetical protein [Actibacterium lipolyticum]|uniref:Uncharacterized protein n=1 Tax=Actibacterium lipolyticum TaxID=1524263 RepID=A0A238KR27_9RHOB|nr:hypothetical protein [Actibacterium lipolyticum]SMX45273.1 hypothetical protein COL8621_02754 [Actibacterium lipolyticum]
MSVEITACQEICRDFGWASGLANWFADLAPVLALVWAIYAYFSQRSADRESELRQERRELYRDFLSQVQVLRVNFYSGTWEDFDEWYQCYKSLAGEIFVTAPEGVVKKIIELESPVTKLGYIRKKHRSDEYRELCDEISNRYFEVIEAMRKDTFPGDQIKSADFSTFLGSTAPEDGTTE